MPSQWLRGLTHNHAQLESDASDSRMRPWEMVGPSAAEVQQQIVDWVQSQSRWDLQSEDQGRLHLTRRTTVFRFVDDIHLQIQSTPSGVRINGESQSRVGKGDLGQNRRNLIELHSAIVDQ